MTRVEGSLAAVKEDTEELKGAVVRVHERIDGLHITISEQFTQAQVAMQKSLDDHVAAESRMEKTEEAVLVGRFDLLAQQITSFGKQMAMVNDSSVERYRMMAERFDQQDRRFNHLEKFLGRVSSALLITLISTIGATIGYLVTHARTVERVYELLNPPIVSAVKDITSGVPLP